MRKSIAYLLIVVFAWGSVCPNVLRAGEISLPVPGTMVHLSPSYNPPVLKGIKVNTDNPFRFEFVLSPGDKTSSVAERESLSAKEDYLKEESAKLIKYFLAALTTPEKDLWVNLSPYEKDRIVPDSFGQTEMGRDLLAQDYLLKQITASLVYPEGDIGKQFWKRIYELAGNKNVPVNTFNKVWIVPNKAVVYENAKAGTAYVVESSLKVMTEQDYLAVSKNVFSPPLAGGARGGERSQQMDVSPLPNPPHKGGGNQEMASQIIRDIILPQLTKEVNEGKNFAQLRQVYNSLILAAWYKKKIKESILSQVYADKNKIRGTEYQDTTNAKAIYERYLQAFKKGTYNYIKEEQDPVTQQMIPRKYFSGGVTLMDVSNAMTAAEGTDVLKNSEQVGALQRIIMELSMPDPSQSMDMSSVSSFKRLRMLGHKTGRNERIFGISNEDFYEDVVEGIRSKDPKRNGAHIGVSGIQNLDIMAARGSQFGILIDINERTNEFFQFLEELFKVNPNFSRADFLKFLQDDRRMMYFLGTIAAKFDFDLFIKGSASWLFTEERFEHIKRMFLEGRIITINGNVSDAEMLQKIAVWMKNESVLLDTFYISNTIDWVTETPEVSLHRIIHDITVEDTIILDSHNKNGLRLNVRNKKDYPSDLAQAAKYGSMKVLPDGREAKVAYQLTAVYNLGSRQESEVRQRVIAVIDAILSRIRTEGWKINVGTDVPADKWDDFSATMRSNGWGRRISTQTVLLNAELNFDEQVKTRMLRAFNDFPIQIVDKIARSYYLMTHRNREVLRSPDIKTDLIMSLAPDDFQVTSQIPQDKKFETDRSYNYKWQNGRGETFEAWLMQMRDYVGNKKGVTRPNVRSGTDLTLKRQRRFLIDDNSLDIKAAKEAIGIVRKALQSLESAEQTIVVLSSGLEDVLPQNITKAVISAGGETRIRVYKDDALRISEYLDAVESLLDEAGDRAMSSENKADTVGFRIKIIGKSLQSSEEFQADLALRKVAEVKNGTRWIRVSATPQEAKTFYEEWKNTDFADSFNAKIGKNLLKMPRTIWSKMVAWVNKDLEFERQGYFVARNIGDALEIIDFVPLGSIARDPVAAGVLDPHATQAFLTLSAFDNRKAELMDELGFSLDVQDSLAIQRMFPLEELVIIPIHSHHRSSYYSNGPSDQDMQLASKGSFEIVFSLQNQIGYLYSNDQVVAVDNAQTNALDKAQAPGGIDLNADKLDLQLQNGGEAIKFKTDPAMLKRLQDAPGFMPVIIDIQPVSDLRVFLGIIS